MGNCTHLCSTNCWCGCPWKLIFKMKWRSPSVALRQGLLWVGLARLGSPPKDQALSLQRLKCLSLFVTIILTGPGDSTSEYWFTFPWQLLLLSIFQILAISSSSKSSKLVPLPMSVLDWLDWFALVYSGFNKYWEKCMERENHIQSYQKYKLVQLW